MCVYIYIYMYTSLIRLQGRSASLVIGPKLACWLIIFWMITTPNGRPAERDFPKATGQGASGWHPVERTPGSHPQRAPSCAGGPRGYYH